MLLTPDQFQAIDRQLRYRHVLQNETLIAELTDHFAQAISVRMATGESFNDAGAGIMESFGGAQGLANLQKEYVSTQNRMAWTTFWRVALRYVTTFRLLPTLSTLAGTYLLLSAYWKSAFYGLWLVTIALYVLVGFGKKALNDDVWSWEAMKQSIAEYGEMPASAIYTRQAGMQWITNLVIIVAFNIPLYQYLFFFPVTFDRPFDSLLGIYASVGFTSSYIGFFCLLELSYRENRFLNWLTKD